MAGQHLHALVVPPRGGSRPEVATVVEALVEPIDAYFDKGEPPGPAGRDP